MNFPVISELRLDHFLVESLPEHSRSKLAKAIDQGLVTVDGALRKASFKLQPGMTVSVGEIRETPVHDLTPVDMDLDIVYEDDECLVVNKPRGLATHPAASLREPTLVNVLLGRGQELSEGTELFRPGIVHRLDKETTGLIIIAKTDAVHLALTKQIANRTAERRYVAIALGEFAQETFTIDAPLARDPFNRLRMSVQSIGKRAITHFKVMKRVEHGTLIGAKLETGRTHQIRAHLLACQHPVLGDALYAPLESLWCPMQLHAAGLAFTQPTTGVRIELRAVPPADFLAEVDLTGIFDS